ncbi:rod shape-determining protein MreD [Clostridium ganghwense]|uniref:Rod shape-determining protein MreD n=1 Tax=Clostridium ganghwense TaxID=312089 RepID=A0ABT4CNW5_9CLOT|nr:rod shape-determining protein MreD [Clostridium ganghwense]MCY6370748.1 rod shape-determining protein MreD [Clostridium ganghwense]
MKKIVTVILLLTLFLILDNALIPFFAIKGYYPSLLFVFAICYSIINDSWSGVFLGIFCGLLQDMYLTNSLGINMFLNMIMCLAASKIGKTIFKDKSLVPIITCFLLSFLKGVLMFAILYILKQYIHIKTSLFISLYNMVVGIFMYKRVYKLCQKDFMVKNWRF